MKSFNFIWFFSLVLFSLQLVTCQYRLDDDGANGVRISGNDRFTVFAQNSQSKYRFTFTHYKSCDVMYFTNGLEPIFRNSGYYVYSLAVMSNNDHAPDSSNFTFVQIAETMTEAPVIVLSVFIIACCPYCNIVLWNSTIVWNGTRQIYMNIKVDPRSQYAYVFADSFVLSFDIAARRLIQLKELKKIVEYPNQYFPRAFDLTNTWAIVTGIYCVQSSCRYEAYLFILESLDKPAYKELPKCTGNDITKLKIYDRENDMSVAVNPRTNRTFISFASRQSIFVIDVKPTTVDPWWSITVEQEIDWTTPNIGFGRSVVWLDDQTVAITLFTVPDRPWSRSEIWVFDISKPFTKPLFVFPNNQQVIMLNQPPLFLHILAWSNNLYVLTDQSKALLIPTRPAGFLSVWPSENDDDVLVYKSAPCIAGTYKNRSSPGPCTVCPSQTKKSADAMNKTSIECVVCPSNSFCPLGSTDIVSLDHLPSYRQSYSYPESPDVNNYDDILLQNIFYFPNSSKCLVVSPLFWMLITIGLCFILWCAMILLKSSKANKIIQMRQTTKAVFKKMNPLNRNSHWIGGLLSIVIVILLSFVYWFAIRYLRTYPLESTSSTYSACSNNQRNSQFHNALQLPLPTVNGHSWKIFEMLNKQQLTMSVDLVNTDVRCSNITIRQIIPRSPYLVIPITECLYQTLTNATRSFTFFLPEHPTTVELIILGPYFIGGIRMCLRGSSLKDNLGNTLELLDVCQFYSTDNQTLGRMISMSIVLIKTINHTQPLEVGGRALYHGRWTPTWNDIIGLSDKRLIEEYGEHLRYAFDRSIISISITEQPFFLQNNQMPIVRKAQLIFHTLLFTSLVIELFALGFAIIKIITLPIRCIRHRRWPWAQHNTAFLSGMIANSHSLQQDPIVRDNELKRRSSIQSVHSHQPQSNNNNTTSDITDRVTKQRSIDNTSDTIINFGND